MARPTSLSSISLSDLHREIARRGEQTAGLRRRRDELLKQVAALNAQIGDEPSMPAKRGPGRPKGSKNRKAVAGAGRPRRTRAKNTTTLAAALSVLLKDKTMGVPELADAVRKGGYKSGAANFNLVVNRTLMSGPFKRVARGMYTVA